MNKKKNKQELEVDFIGGQVSLTVAKERSISNYLQQKKSKKKPGKIKSDSSVKSDQTTPNRRKQ